MLDAVFDGRITRISNTSRLPFSSDRDKVWPNQFRCIYSTTLVLNADMPLMINLNREITRASNDSGAPDLTLVDGVSYKPLKKPSAILQAGRMRLQYAGIILKPTS